jgi:uncharacterized membrane protein
MGLIEGERTLEVDAPIQRVFDIAAKVENAAEWQDSLQEVEVLERHPDGRPDLVETKSDAKVKSVRALLRFDFTEPTEIHWVQQKGDTKSLEGWWRFVDLGGDRTRATYALVADPGRILGMLMRGPAEGMVRDMLVGGAVEGLKRLAEE